MLCPYTAHRSGEAGGGWGSPSELHPHPPPVAVEDTVQHEDYHTLSRLEYVTLWFVQTYSLCVFVVVVVVVVVVVRDEERNTEQERRLVDDITAPGGVKAAPPRDSLNRFISRSALSLSLSISLSRSLLCESIVCVCTYVCMCVCVHMYVCVCVSVLVVVQV